MSSDDYILTDTNFYFFGALRMSGAARDRYQEPTQWQRLLAAFLRLLDKKIVGPTIRQISDLLAARQVTEDQIVLKPVPAMELAASFMPLDNGGVYQRRCPTVISGSAASHDELAAAAQQPVIPLSFGVAEFDNAVTCGDGVIWKKTQSGVCAVEESLATANSVRSILPLVRSEDGILHVYPNVKIRKLPPEPRYALLRQPWDNNYGHWITESLPKVALLAERYDITKLKFLVTRHSFVPPIRRMRQVCIDSLAAYGIQPQQIVWVGHEAVEVEHLLYALPMTVHPWIKAPRIIQILEELGHRVAAGHKGPRRIYSSRASAMQRQLVNESEILQVLREFDVAILDPGAMSFADQVRAFSDAELVIGNCGANLTNAVFSPRGIKIFAVTTELMKDDFFWDLANLKSGKYFSLHGKAVVQNPDINSDFEIDPGQFRDFLVQHVLPN